MWKKKIRPKCKICFKKSLVDDDNAHDDNNVDDVINKEKKLYLGVI